MKLLLLLCGPAVMILIGLQGVGSVPVTFVLFYSWLLLVPLVDMLLRKEKKLSQAMRDCGLVFRRKNMYSGMSTGIFFFLAILCGRLFLSLACFPSGEAAKPADRVEFFRRSSHMAHFDSFIGESLSGRAVLERVHIS